MIKKQNGFSLIEVIIVLLIMAILVVAALPQIQRNLQLYRLETATGLLSNRLTETRLTAVKHNRPAWLEINAAARTLEVWTTDAANQPVRAKTSLAISDNVVIDSASPARVTFNSLGRNQTNTNSVVWFRLANTNFCKAVTVSAVGSITSAPC